jgi:hypothetical protein
MNDKQKQVNEMIAEIDQLADKLISDTYAFKYKIANRLLFVGSLCALLSFVAISLHAYLN